MKCYEGSGSLEEVYEEQIDNQLDTVLTMKTNVWLNTFGKLGENQTVCGLAACARAQIPNNQHANTPTTKYSGRVIAYTNYNRLNLLSVYLLFCIWEINYSQTCTSSLYNYHNEVISDQMFSLWQGDKSDLFESRSTMYSKY